jgi:hypothetical protein
MRIQDSESGQVDLCRSCIPTEAEARKKYGQGPDGPDGRGNCYEYDTENPWFFDGLNDLGDEWMADDGYDCAECGVRLTQFDVHPRLASHPLIKAWQKNLSTEYKIQEEKKS